MHAEPGTDLFLADVMGRVRITFIAVSLSLFVAPNGTAVERIDNWPSTPVDAERFAPTWL